MTYGKTNNVITQPKHANQTTSTYLGTHYNNVWHSSVVVYLYILAKVIQKRKVLTFLSYKCWMMHFLRWNCRFFFQIIELTKQTDELNWGSKIWFKSKINEQKRKEFYKKENLLKLFIDLYLNDLIKINVWLFNRLFLFTIFHTGI